MAFLLLRHMHNFLRVRTTIAHHSQLTGIDPGRAKFSGLIDTDHLMHFIARDGRAGHIITLKHFLRCALAKPIW